MPGITWKFALLKDTDGNYYTLEEYKKKIEDTQTNKDKRLVYLYATNEDEQYANIENAKSRGYNVLLMDGILDSHFISSMEQKFENTQFSRVDSNTIDKLIEKKDDDTVSKLSDSDKESIKASFEAIIDKTVFSIEFVNMNENEVPVELTQNEWMRRMKDMNMVGGMSMWGDMPDHYTLIINTNNNVITSLVNKDEDSRKEVISQLYDLVRLSKNLLKGKELNEFIKRNFDSMQ